MYNIFGHRKIFLIISGILVSISILALIVWGLRPGIDFTGGTIMELSYQEETPATEELREKLTKLDLGEIIIQSSGQSGMLFRFKEIDEEIHQKIVNAIKEVDSNFEEIRYESIGPTIGRELTRKARTAVILAVAAIILYVAWAFRKLTRIAKGESWRYGIGAILALAHDVIIILGLFSIMGYFSKWEINTNFIVAILTVLGYSVNDTIVVYDRIRENLLNYKSKNLEQTINLSLNETITRTLNTTITTILALLAIYLFGGATIKDFVLALMVGVASGTWSSISIASPFLLFKRKKY